MKAKRMFLTLMLSAMTSICVWSIDVYWYTTGNSTPSLTNTGVQKMIFKEGKVDMVDADQQVLQSVSLTDYDLFSFKNTNTTGINAISGDHLSLSFDGNTVQLTSAALIDRVDVYSASGVNMLSLSPAAKSLQLNVGSFVKGVYMVKVTSAGKETVRKIIK